MPAQKSLTFTGLNPKSPMKFGNGSTSAVSKPTLMGDVKPMTHKPLLSDAERQVKRVVSCRRVVLRTVVSSEQPRRCAVRPWGMTPWCRSIRTALGTSGRTSVSRSGRRQAKRPLSSARSINARWLLRFPVASWSTSRWIR